MQNMKLRDFQNILDEYGYVRTRNNGGSHTVYERSVTIGSVTFKDSISIPTNNKMLSGPMAKRLVKQITEFDNTICMLQLNMECNKNGFLAKKGGK